MLPAVGFIHLEAGMNNNGLARLVPIAVGLIGVLVLLARGCQEGPFGRRQLVAMSPEQEAHLGAQAFQEVLSESEVLRSGPIVDVVVDVGKRLAEASNNSTLLRETKLKRQKFDWQFRVVRSKQVNAFCLPGGKVVVYTGILPVCETDGGLATVMGHEIGHALAHHGAERMAQQQLVQYGQVAVAGSLGDVDPRKRAEILAVLGAGSQFGFLLPHSRGQESEADHIGLLLMSTAGYDPRDAIEFWSRMDKQSGGKSPPEFASTHPNHGTRIADLQKWLPEAMQLYDKSRAQNAEKPLPRP
jgi:predicted Zn-dependent protease